MSCARATRFTAVNATAPESLAKYEKRFALDVPTNQWMVLPPMLIPRHGLQLATIDAALFAVGGCMPGDDNLFDVVKNESYVTPAARPSSPVARDGAGALIMLLVLMLGTAWLLPRLRTET